MSILGLARRALNEAAVATGLRSDEWSMRRALERTRGIHLGGIVDVGASNRSWSRLAQRAWPAARFLLIEAQPVHEPGLRRSGFPYVLAAAGAAQGTTHFDATDPWGGVASPQPTGPADIVVPMTTVDAEVERFHLPPLYLLKLDTHGFEREALAGASATLEGAALLVIEAYNFEIRPGAYVSMSSSRRSRSAGSGASVADPMHRKRDDAFWQLDLIFARADLSTFDSVSYV